MDTRDTLLAAAVAIERRKAEDFSRLARRLSDAGNASAGDVFSDLAEEAEAATDRLGHQEQAADDGPEPLSDTEIEEAGGLLLLSPYQCYRLAVDAEKRILDFYVQASAHAPDEETLLCAERLAKEKVDHLVQLRLRRRRAYRSDHADLNDAKPPPIADLTALNRFVAAQANDAVHTAERQAEILQTAGATDAARLFRELAERKRLLTALANSPGAGQPDPFPTETGPALREALKRAERDFQLFSAIASTSHDEAVQSKARDFLADAVKDLADITSALNSPPSGDGETGD
jgi:rubrerythrin